MKVLDNKEYESYNAEAQERWGHTDAYKEYSEKSKNYGKDKWSSLAADMDIIFSEFSKDMNMGISPDAAETQCLVRKLQIYITENYYNCTKEILYGLGQMYVADERFKNNIDKHANGTAAFVSEAITYFVNK